MPQWAERYDERERAAIENAYLAKPRPARAIRERAEAGELAHNGQPVPPFKVPDSTIRDIGKKAARRRRGQMPSDLIGMAHVDAVELLRRRYMSILDNELERLEIMRTPVDLEQLRKLGRVLRELAALPDPKTARATQAGNTTRGSRSGQTDLAESIRRATIKAEPTTPTPPEPEPPTEPTEPPTIPDVPGIRDPAPSAETVADRRDALLAGVPSQA